MSSFKDVEAEEGGLRINILVAIIGRTVTTKIGMTISLEISV